MHTRRNHIIFIYFYCDSCGREMDSTDFFVGTIQTCEACGHRVKVPRVSSSKRSEAPHRHEKKEERGQRFYAAVLELEKLGPGEVKQAYKRQLMRYHPDRVEHLGKEFVEMANQKTKLINEAYRYFLEEFKVES